MSSDPSGALFGSIPSNDPINAGLALTLPDAIERGLRFNLGVIGGTLGMRRAAAARLTELSNLLPNVAGRVVGSSQQVNLKAFGFGGFPGVPSIVGPFSVLDFRAALTQAIFDLSALSNWRSSRETVRSAELMNRNIRDSVVLAVVSLYLQATAGNARIQSAQAQVATADAEYRQALSMKDAGTVAGIDVLRAQVQLRAEQQRLIALRNDFERQKLDLARAIGLAVGQTFSIATQIPYAAAEALSLEDALRQSLLNRPDYQAALASERAAELQRRGASAERLPAIYFNGDYGTIGPSVRDTHGTYTAALGVQFPIFEGGRIRAAIEQADVNLTQRRAESGDLRGRIDYEVRTSFLNLNAARERTEVAQETRNLAAQQLAQSRDRFAAGVANNLEVVQAQQAVAIAEENYIGSLYEYNLARAAIARSVGRAQDITAQLVGAGTK
jgi:outer membrane protein TolC